MELLYDTFFARLLQNAFELPSRIDTATFTMYTTIGTAIAIFI